MSKYSNIDWKSMIQEQMESGLTVSKFCESKNIHEKAFYSYKRKFKDKETNATVSFEPVTVEHSSFVSLKINGIMLEFDKEFLPQILKAIVL